MYMWLGIGARSIVYIFIHLNDSGIGATVWLLTQRPADPEVDVEAALAAPGATVAKAFANVLTIAIAVTCAMVSVSDCATP